MSTQEQINRLVDRLARRVRVQRAIEGGTTGLTVSAMLSLLLLVLLKTGWIVADEFSVGMVVALSFTPLFAVASAARRLDPIALAQAIDRSHGLHDRLSTALALSELAELSKFEEAQIADAAGFVDKVETRRAAPMQRPTDLAPLAALLGCVCAIVLIRPPTYEMQIRELPPIEHQQILDTATIAMERDRLEAIKRELEGIEDPEAIELLEEIETLLNQVENREISEREFLDRLKKLEDKHLGDGVQMEPQEAERLAEKLKEAAEKLEKEAKKDLEKEPAAQELVDAMKKGDLDRASKAMEKLAEMLAKKDISDKQLERLANIMEKLSKHIDFNDPALQKLIEKNKKLIDKLSKKFDKLNDKDKQRLNRAKEELEKQQAEQNKNAERDSSRQLKELRRLSAKAAEEAKKVLKGGKGEKEATEDTKHEFKQQAGRYAKDAAKQMGEGGEEQRKDKAREMARKQLEGMREAMQRGKSGQGQQNRGDAQKLDRERGKQMKEFLDRAKGKQPGKFDMKASVEQMQPGSGEGPDGPKQKVPGESKGGKEGGESGAEGEEESNMAGKGKGGRELGEESQLDGKRKDEKVDIDASGKGPSRSEIIKSASEEGFATTEYKDVYVDYSSVVEEVMEKEKIPAGYRYYVKRYFQLIQPQE